LALGCPPQWRHEVRAGLAGDVTKGGSQLAPGEKVVLLPRGAAAAQKEINALAERALKARWFIADSAMNRHADASCNPRSAQKSVV